MNISKLSFLLLILSCSTVFAQAPSISENKKVKYLKRIEKKNTQYVFTEKEKNVHLLDKLSKNENKLIALNPSTINNGFELLKVQLNSDQLKLKDTTVNSNQPLFLTDIPANLDYKVKDYLRKQITMFHYLTDSVSSNSIRLQKQAEKTKRNILETENQLAALQTIEKKTQRHREELKKRCEELPEAQKELKKIDKSCYYFTQGMNGFKSEYTSPASGIENNLSKALTFNTDYLKFADNISATQGISTASGAGSTDLSGLQTKVQVQALLPQNAAGISPEQKSMLVANMAGSFNKFQELRNKRPDLSALKDRPNFKANPYKGIPLKQRVQFGKEFQIHAKNKYYPLIADLGVTLGFKLTARITPLIGAFYKLGLGDDLTHTRLSSEGIIARGGFDFKIAYGFSIQCLYEETFKFIPKMINENPATMQEPSFIIGIMNKCKISKKTSSTIFFGYDFLHNQHTPYTTPWVIRVGWQ